MPTGLQVLDRLVEYGLTRPGFFTSAGTASAPVDTRWKGSIFNPTQWGAAHLYVTGGTRKGQLSPVERLDVTTGTIYLASPLTGAVAQNDTYEIWLWGILPEDGLRARDRALTERCQVWRMKQLSVLSNVETWTTKLSIPQNETLTPQAPDFPDEWFDASLLIDQTPAGGNANGGAESESFYCKPGQQFVLFGLNSTRAQTSQAKLRDVTNGADIALTGSVQNPGGLAPGTFQYRGWSYFELLGTAPASPACEQVRVRITGANANAIHEWAGVGLLPQTGRQFVLPSRVLNAGDVGRFFRLSSPGFPPGDGWRNELVGGERFRSGNNTAVRLPAAAGPMGVYYDEAHHYAALVSNYLDATVRGAAEAASTDCPLRYVAAAAAVDLIESLGVPAELRDFYGKALKDLNAYDYWDGARPQVITEVTRPAVVQRRV